MRTVAIIQSRLGSTRLPRKALADINGKPLIQHVLERVRGVSAINTIVLATTILPEDDPLATLASKLRVPIYRGPSQDVLARFYYCALSFNADVVVRITGDDPLWDPVGGSIIVQAFLGGDADYCHNIDLGTDGFDTEVMSFKALRQAHEDATNQYDREHVTTWIRRSGFFNVARLVPRRIPGGAKWSVDTEADLERVRAVFAQKEAA